ncbi:MAG: InlB B-repeat-containing protein, partial [Conexivisphaera sp.]
MSTLIGGLIAIALFIVVVFTITFFYSAALGGFLHEFQIAETINYKNSEYLVVSYSFNSTLGTGNLTVTNGGKYPARIVEILKVPANGGPATLIPENVTIWPGQSHTFVGVLQQGYHYAVVTSYGNTWWSSFGVVNPVAGKYSLTIQIVTIPGGDGGSTSPPPGTYYYSYGTEVTIGARANSGYAFQGWVGQGGYSYTGTNATATIYTWDNMTETAVFVGQPQPVTFSEQGIPSSASVSPALLTVSYNGTTYQFSPSQLPVTLQIPTGTTVTYSWASPVYDSTPGIRYLWVSTTGLATGETGSFMVPAGGGSVTATYSTQYELTVNIGQGLTVNVNPPNISANTGQIQEWYNPGTQVTLTATGS